MSVLAFDLGTRLGWFLGNAVGPCEWGTIELKATTRLGDWLRSADQPLRDLLPYADAVVVEKPNTAGNSNYFPIRKNFALLGHLAYWSAFHGISDITEISVMTAKLTLAGSGRADKTMMIAAAAADGHEGMDEHSADAYGIWKTFVFGARAPVAKARSRSGPGKVITP